MSDGACPHGRSYETCIRCDPFCPRGLPDEQYDSWQRTYDEMRERQTVATVVEVDREARTVTLDVRRR